jgi:hypothetical protein
MSAGAGNPVIAARRPRRLARPAAASPTPGALAVALPPEWRTFVGHWLETEGCVIRPAARGDWEVELSAPLQKRWRRQRVRLVFDPLRPTLPRGAWFTAPGSGSGRKILEACLDQPAITHRTALPQVPGAPANGIAAVCRVRGLTWGPPRLGPVRYERRIAFHVVLTRWGGLPLREPWIVVVDGSGTCVDRAPGVELPDVRVREGLANLPGALEADGRHAVWAHGRKHVEALVDERIAEWGQALSHRRDDELGRLGAFFSARIEEEEERLRRRVGGGEESEVENQGDATSLKLEWERRAAEVRQRWAIRSEVRLWGISEWSWPVAVIDQELRTGAVHVRLHSRVDVARGLPGLPPCPTCGAPAEMLVRVRGSVACVRCAPA